jgi:myo-inositol-1(or 4)-monophosphatase
VTSQGWLPIFRAIAADVRAAITPLSGTADGRSVVGRGAGGDATVYLDQIAEQIVIRHLEQAYRSGFRFCVLCDPLDGSYNAKSGLPYYAVVLAITDGDRTADVVFGYVQNLVTGDEFHAARDGGAVRNGRPFQPGPPEFDGKMIPLVQFDAPTGVEPRGQALAIFERAEKIRQLGSAALNLCHTAAGGISLQVTPAPVRAFDLAAPLLILREAGGLATDFDGGSLDDVSVRLDSRTTLLASRSPEIHRFALQLLGRH